MTQFVVYLSGRSTHCFQEIRVPFVRCSDRSCVGRCQVPNMMGGGWGPGAAGADPRLQRAQMIAAAQQQVQ